MPKILPYTKYIFKTLNNLTRNYPTINYYLYKRPTNYLFRFKNEVKLVNKGDFNQSKDQSIILFTIHKCASVYTHKLISSAIKNKSIIHIDFDSYFSETFPHKYRLFNDHKFLNKVFCSRGYFYGPFRSFRKVPNLQEYKTILILRDPRDVLTSQYFSFGFSHKLINPKMIKNRKEIGKKSIDKYVIEASSEYKRIFSEYMLLKQNNPNILFLKYENMISDFKPWLKQIFDFLEVSTIDNKTFDDLINKASFTVKKEDIHSHIRNIQSGDHLKKLKKETIEKINIILREELDFFDYK